MWRQSGGKVAAKWRHLFQWRQSGGSFFSGGTVTEKAVSGGIFVSGGTFGGKVAAKWRQSGGTFFSGGKVGEKDVSGGMVKKWRLREPCPQCNAGLQASWALGA